MSVRRAVPADIPVLLSHAFSVIQSLPAYCGIPLDVPRVQSFLETLIQNPLDYVVLVSEAGQEITGFMFGCVVPHWFSKARTTAVDLCLHVYEQRRGGRSGLQLIRAFESWAEEVGCSRVQLGISTGVHADKTQGMYLRMGYAVVGTINEKGI